MGPAADPRTPLAYLSDLAPDDLPPALDDGEVLQRSRALASKDEHSGQVAVFLELDPDLHDDPVSARALLEPGTEIDQVVVGWTTRLDGVDAEESSLSFEVHWRLSPTSTWSSARLGIDALAEDEFTFIALMEAAAGAAIALVTPAAIDAMLGVGQAPEHATILPRTPLTALAGYLTVVAASQLARVEWDRMPDPPGQLTTSQYAELPSMRTAERNARKIAAARMTVPRDHEAFLPFLTHQRWAAQAAQARFDDAQPLIISHELLAALPDFENGEQAVRFALGAPLPLPVVYLDCTDRRGQPAQIVSHAHDGRRRQAAPIPLFGALMWRDEHGLHAVPFGRASADGPVCEPAMHLLFCEEPQPVYGVALLGDRVFAAPTPQLPDIEGQQLARSMGYHGMLVGELLAAALMLTSAARVDVRPRELTAKQAKLARKRGHQPGWEVAVRAPKATPSAGPGHSRRYANPFWRRGTMAAYPVGTQIADAADPDQLVWIPWKDAMCRLVWHAPTIVGASQADDPTVARRARRWSSGRVQLPGDKP